MEDREREERLRERRRECMCLLIASSCPPPSSPTPHRDTPQQVILTIPVFEEQPPQSVLSLVSDRWIGAETITPIDSAYVLPNDFPPHTDLLDLSPLPTSALKRKGAIARDAKKHTLTHAHVHINTIAHMHA